MNFPTDLDSELGLLGYIIDKKGTGWNTVERDLLTDARAILLADTVEGLISDNQPIELFTVSKRCGDCLLVAESINHSNGGLEYLLGILREKRALRVLQADANKTLSIVAELDDERRKIDSDIATRIFESGTAQRAALAALAGSKKRTPKEILGQVLDRLEAADRGELPPSIPTGIAGVDALLDGGLQRHFMVSIGARSGVGKTALAIWIAAAACRAGKSVLYGSRELPGALIAHRLLCLESETPFRLTDGTRGIPSAKRSSVTAAQNRIKDWQLDVRDDVSTAEQLIAEASRSNPDLLVVDHIGIFGVNQRKGASPFEDMTRKSNLLRDFAKDSGVPTVVLCQLNRAAVDADRPGLHHLKQSGALEEDSRAVLLLSVAEQEVKGSVDRLEIDVAKNTIGRCGLVTVDFHKSTNRFLQYREPFEP